MADADTGEGRAASSCSTASPRRNAGAGPSEEPVGTVPSPRPPGRAGRTSVRAPVGTICPVYRTELAATPLARSARTASNGRVTTAQPRTPLPTTPAPARTTSTSPVGPARSTAATTVVLGVGPVSFDDVIAVARRGAAVAIGAESRHAMATSRSIVDALAGDSSPHYGISTGFGALATTSIAPSRRAALQASLTRSHAAGPGAPRPAGCGRLSEASTTAGDRDDIVEADRTHPEHDGGGSGRTGWADRRCRRRPRRCRCGR